MRHNYSISEDSEIYTALRAALKADGEQLEFCGFSFGISKLLGFNLQPCLCLAGDIEEYLHLQFAVILEYTSHSELLSHFYSILSRDGATYPQKNGNISV